MRHKAYHEYLIVFLVYFILTLIFTYPLSMKPGIVFDYIDYFQNIWNFWWIKKALLRLHTSPYFTSYLFYPQGTKLVFHTLSLYNSVLSIPLQMIFSRPTVYTILFLSSFVLSGFGTYLLVLYLTRNRFGAFLAGIIYSFSPFHQEHLSEINIASIQWIPFFCLYLMKTFWEGKVKDAILCAVFFTLVSLCSWYYALFLVLFTCLFIVYHLILREKRLWDPKLLKNFGIIILLSAILISPFTYPLIKEALSDSSYLYAPSFHLAGLLGIRYPEGSLTFWPAALGYMVTFLSIYFILKIRDKKTHFWSFMTIFFFILTLGPYLIFLYKAYPQIPLPMAILQKIPIISAIRYPYRFMVLVMLGLAVMSGFVCKMFTNSLKGKIILFFITSLIIFEYLSIPLPVPSSSITIPKIYGIIAADKGDFAIMDVPLNIYCSAFSMYYQTFHEKKIVGGYISRTPPSALEFIHGNQFVRLLLNLTSFRLFKKDKIDFKKDVELLKEKNIRYIIFHKDFLLRKRPSISLSLWKGLVPYSVSKTKIWPRYTDSKHRGISPKDAFATEAELQEFIQFITSILGRPIFEDRDIVAYKIVKNGKGTI